MLACVPSLLNLVASSGLQHSSTVPALAAEVEAAGTEPLKRHSVIGRTCEVGEDRMVVAVDVAVVAGNDVRLPNLMRDRYPVL